MTSVLYGGSLNYQVVILYRVRFVVFVVNSMKSVVLLQISIIALIRLILLLYLKRRQSLSRQLVLLKPPPLLLLHRLQVVDHHMLHD
jgi:hypothetical protein